MRVLILNNSIIRVTNNRNNEVHEDHEKIEDRHNENEPGETNNQVTMDMLSTFIHDIESGVIFKQWKVSHRATQNGDKMCQQSWNSTVGANLDLDDMVALSEGK